MKFKNSIATVDLMGGLGNQLFQICFANYLKENGVNVYMSEEWFFNNRQLKILADRKPMFDLTTLI